MPTRVVVAVIAAGAASAVLFGTTLTGTLLLAYFAQLPLFIVGLSHGWTAAAAASAVGSVGMLALGSVGLAVAFATMEAIPVVILCWRALRHRQRPDGTIEWFGPGALATDAMVISLAIAVGQAFMFDRFAGGPEGLLERLGPMLAAMGAQPDDAMRGVIVALLRVLPGIAAASWFWMLVVNGALAQWICLRAGSAWRPSPRMADLEMPRWPSELFAVAALGSLLPGFAGLLGENMVVAQLGGAFALAGFAIIHALAARGGNRLMLVATYLIVVVFGLPLLLIAVAGVLEPWLRLRARFLSGAAPRA